MSTRAGLENYLEIDHRESPGLDPGHCVRIGFGRIAAQLGKGGHVKVPTATCSHCQKQLILNPLRTRDREICPKCDKYLCDRCKLHYSLTGKCEPFGAMIERLTRAAEVKVF